MASTGVVDIFLVYQFLRRLATPFDKWDAYKTGVIDKLGNVITSKNKRDQKQKDSFKVFDVMILRLKRLLGKVPGGKTRIASYAAALWLVREYDESKTEDTVLTEEIDYLKYIHDVRNERFRSFKKFMEDAPTMATGSAVVGTGDSGVSWMGKKARRKHKVLSRASTMFSKM